ncbi:putative RNA-directed DNA polymerase [Helianthus annuus]|uniref:RNA-directed DNA polymerase n=1 Tax=Helianthus annuus TaxID=4232 RepID=A0A9K3GYU3_HELAN|nr:putative RNA-directed DNA polymerase [Helianthus annuus]KAF5780555.1 putative RNA-directed DNA polymerase [Helianthus annuus]KAF5812400.1 putative RNA-directed DNA polymerase [Helianthus annuus]
MVNRFWGRSILEFEAVESSGRSGGLLTIWDPSVFTRSGVVKNRNYLAIMGNIEMTGETIVVVNVYAQNDPGDRRDLWTELLQLRRSTSGMWVFLGDFNDVRCPEERLNSEFIAINAQFFNHFITEADLVEYQMGGRQYTYMSDNGTKMSKLDRFLVSRDFMSKWPLASCMALSKLASDHCPILLSTTQTDYGKIPSRMFNSWFEIPGATEQVIHLLGIFQFEGLPDLALDVKLKWVKRRLKEWVFVRKADMESSYNTKLKRLEELELAAEQRSLDQAELEERVECKSQVLETDRLKAMDMQQKSRVRWAKEGDENTKYFHGVMNANTTNNRIHGLHIDGVWVTSPPLVKDHAFSFFAEKFEEPLVSRPVLQCPFLSSVSNVEAEALESPFTLNEIKSAVWECDGDRAPGPDGINLRFIKKFWDELEGDFMRLFQHFYSAEQLNNGCMSSFLALIPKRSDPGGLHEYRPISLIGCINKVVSKVLVNRLKAVIHKLVSEEQTGFLAGRSIIDGVIILNEIIPWLKRNKSEGMILKVDIEKAYDSLSWDFLNSMLCQMNFPVKWRRWVMSIVTSARASVLVNGSPTQEFTCSRGLRQGDPLSPFLFVLAMEALTGVMKKACDIGVIQGLSLSPTGGQISHFLYADDVIFVGKWSFNNLLNLKRILRCFYLSSGLKVNLKKSSLYGVGIEDSHVQLMANMLGCTRGTFPFKYLGLQVGANMNLIKNWDPVVETFQKRLSLWKAKTISLGGRITLVSSVLNALPTYYFSLYKAPLGVIKKLEKLRRDFLWGSNPEQEKMKWVAWKSMMTPKDLGGMGFGSLRAVNLAMLSKWWWRFKVERDSLWKKVVWEVHNNSRTWSFIPAKMSMAGPWKQIHNLKIDFNAMGFCLESLFRGSPGSDREMFFWKERWLFEEPLCEKFPALFQLERYKNVLIKERVVDGPNGLELKFLWIRLPSVAAEISELNILSDAIVRYEFGLGADKWAWILDSSGSFSVSSVKEKTHRLMFSDLRLDFEWNNWSPIKVNFLVWRLIQDKLPTKAALNRRNVIIEDNRCKMCGDEEESALHLFASCRIAEQIWEFITRWCRIKQVLVLELKDLANIHKCNRGSHRWKKTVNLVTQATIWVIWRSRNEAVFEGKQPYVNRMKEEIKMFGYMWLKSRVKNANISWENWCNFDLISLGV